MRVMYEGRNKTGAYRVMRLEGDMDICVIARPFWVSVSGDCVRGVWLIASAFCDGLNEPENWASIGE